MSSKSTGIDAPNSPLGHQAVPSPAGPVLPVTLASPETGAGLRQARRVEYEVRSPEAKRLSLPVHPAQSGGEQEASLIRLKFTRQAQQVQLHPQHARLR